MHRKDRSRGPKHERNYAARQPRPEKSPRQLAAERDLNSPLLCHTIASDGILRDGFEIELNRDLGSHSLHAGDIKVVSGRGGCYYHYLDGTAKVFRAALVSENGVHELKQAHSNTASLVFADLTPSKNVKELKERFWSGVRTDAKSRIGNNSKHLIEMEDGQTADLYLKCGRVVRLERRDGTVAVRTLSLEDQVTLRISLLDEMLKAALAITGTGRLRQLRQRFREAIGIMAVAGRFSAYALEITATMLEEGYKQKMLEPEIEARFFEILKVRWPAKCILLRQERDDPGNDEKLIALPPKFEDRVAREKKASGGAA